jgi:hypothetical protein
MRTCSFRDVLLKVLGLLLLTAAVLKGHELLTVPVANKDLWSWRPFLIFQVEFELALGIWLLSGVFKRLAWLTAMTCFGLFCCVALYKGLTGATSCGCFGRIHINPWITLTTIDLPALVSLSLFRPTHLLGPFLSFLRRRESIFNMVGEYIEPLPSGSEFATAMGLGLLLLGMTTPILAVTKPAAITSTYEVLAPETWVGKELPILASIDIGEQLRRGAWLLLFYDHDCSHCQDALPQYEQMARDLAGNEDFLQVAMVEVPPYGPIPFTGNQIRALGHLANTKEWFITTPALVLLKEARVTAAWEQTLPGLETVIAGIETSDETP